MDYEKKYKAALNWMKDVYPTLEGAAKEDANHYFPELKESEDERIRRNIIAALIGEGYYDCDLTNECIAWVKKQGKQKPFDYENATIQQTDFAPKVEQKPQRIISAEAKEAMYDKPAWSEEDESIALGVEQLCNCASLLNIAPDKIDKIRTWLKSLKGRYTWKPSDEQMDSLEHFVRSVGESGYASPYENNTKLLYSLLSDLKKLREE